MKTSFKASPTSRTSSSRGLRFGAAAAALLCAFAALPPALAADDGATRTGKGEAVLNFVGADIDSVVRAVGHYTNITFVIDPRVKGTINLVSEKPVSKAQAFQMLSSALRLQGYSVVLNGDYAKVVPEADAKLQATPVQAGKAHGDQIVTQIFRLNYESAQSMVAVLRPLISPNNTINAEPGSNTLVITDYADNMKRLGRIINALDSPSTADLDVIPIRYAVASDIAVMVNRLLEGGGHAQNAAAAAAADRTMLLADPRTNSVIVRAQSAARANLAKSLVAKLDQPTALPGNIHIVYLRNADAVKLAQTLRSVVAADTSSLSQSGSSSSNSFNQNGGGSAFGNSTNGSSSSMSQNSSSAGLLGGSSNSGSNNANGPSSSSSLSAAGGAGGFIQADASTNTLIITASEPVYRNLRTVIDQLDVRRAQVYVESLIVEVTSDTAAELGIQWLGLSGNSNSAVRIGAGTSFSTGGDNLFQQAVNIKTNGIPAAPGNGLTLGVFRQLANGQLGLGALARALESNANANILSVPNLVTLDNEEAKIIVGQNVPFITGQYTTAASGGAAGVNPFQTIERQDIGIALRVRPQITEGGTVKMHIYQEVSSIASSTNTAGIITNKRSLESNVLVDDGQTLVLGGLIQDNGNGTVEKVPGLGDLPFIGGLFRYRKQSLNKTNLIIFLRPIIIRDNEKSVDVLNDRYDYFRNRQIGAALPDSPILPHIENPVLPPLQNGQLIGGGATLRNVPPAAGQQPAAPAIDLRQLPGQQPNQPPAPSPQPAPAPQSPSASPRPATGNDVYAN